MEQFGLRHRLVLASVKEQDFGKNLVLVIIIIIIAIINILKEKDFRNICW